MRVCSAFLLLAPALSQAQGQLTLDQALDVAMRSNGTILSSQYQYRASVSNALAAKSSYYPSLTPSYSYETSRLDTLTGPAKGLFNDVTGSSSVTASYLLFDDGTRDATFRASAASRDASKFSATATVRQVLFDVHRAFFDTIRAEETLKVRRRQLERAIEVEKQAKAFAEEGAGAQKDVLQTTADALNAKAEEISARNRVVATRSSLKAILGLEVNEPLGELVPPTEEQQDQVPDQLADAIDMGLTNRQDLESLRSRVDAQRNSMRLARIRSQATWSLDARYVKSFSEENFDQSALVFQVTVPLFDGFRSRESLKSEELSLKSLRSDLTQSERLAVAEIESAFNEFALNGERIAAATAALEAAQRNYDAAFESRKEGAGDLLEVLTAQVSLTTAESNMIAAQYDLLTSRVRLRLVTGQTIRGERL